MFNTEEINLLQRTVENLGYRLAELECQVFGDQPRFSEAPSLLRRVNAVRDTVALLAQATGHEYFHEVKPAIPEQRKFGFRKARKTKKN